MNNLKYHRYIEDFFKEKHNKMKECYNYLKDNKKIVINEILEKYFNTKNYSTLKDFNTIININGSIFEVKLSIITHRPDYLNLLYYHVYKYSKFILYKNKELLFYEDKDNVIMKKCREIVNNIYNSKEDKNIKLIKHFKNEAEKIFSCNIKFTNKIYFYDNIFSRKYTFNLKDYIHNKQINCIIEDQYTDILYEDLSSHGYHKFNFQLNDSTILKNETIQTIDKLILKDKLENKLLEKDIKVKINKI